MEHLRGSEMNRRMIVLVALALMALLVAAPSVDAKGGNTRVERRITLSATAAGKTIHAKGHARTRVQGTRQSLTVEVEARVANGTTFDVFVSNGGTIVKAGTIKIVGGENEIELKN